MRSLMDKDKRVGLKEIIEEIGTPSAFTAKILQRLAKNGIMDSLRGPGDGFRIAKARIDEIKLSDIIFAIDGNPIYEGCGLGLDECNANRPCPLHEKFLVV